MFDMNTVSLIIFSNAGASNSNCCLIVQCCYCMPYSLGRLEGLVSEKLLDAVCGHTVSVDSGFVVNWSSRPSYCIPYVLGALFGRRHGTGYSRGEGITAHRYAPYHIKSLYDVAMIYISVLVFRSHVWLRLTLQCIEY